jgi:hypothetical protein
MEIGNARICADACSFYPFFGFECPTQNEVHCQCYTRERFGDKPVETADCNALVTGDKFHCTGSAMIDGISMGGADIGSIYEVSSPSDGSSFSPFEGPYNNIDI